MAYIEKSLQTHRGPSHRYKQTHDTCITNYYYVEFVSDCVFGGLHKYRQSEADISVQIQSPELLFSYTAKAGEGAAEVSILKE